jgi:hypothetical protein
VPFQVRKEKPGATQNTKETPLAVSESVGVFSKITKTWTSKIKLYELRKGKKERKRKRD